MRRIGVNTFGLGSLSVQDFEGTFQQLKEMGFTSAEPLVVFSQTFGIPAKQLSEGFVQGGYGMFWVDQMASENIRRLRDMGFSVEGAHLSMAERVPGGLKAVLPFLGPFAAENHLRFYVYSPQKETIQEAKEIVGPLREGIAGLKRQGVELLFHCHYNEFRDDGGDNVFDYLLREIPELRVELDVGWVHYAGEDVIRLMRNYADRIAIIHFKDFAGPVGSEKKFCAIGEGCLPLREIVREAEKLTLMEPPYIIDQDSSCGDMLADLRTGLQNIRACESV